MRIRKQFGLDTETPLGKLGCIATNEEAVEAATFEEVMEFLSKHRYQGSIFWLFNHRFDCEHILKTTGDKAFLQDLYDNGARRPGIEYNGYHIQYIQSKLMKICKNHHCITFYDIAQFYRGASLDSAGKQYLPEEYRKDTSTVSAERIGEEKGYYEEHITDILKYCKQDAVATLALAKLIETTFTSKGISFRSPISQAKISEIYVTDHYKHYPGVPPGLEKFHLAAQAAFHGGLFWTLQRGYFRLPVFCYDINSAYPAVMSKLPNWLNGHFEDGKKIDKPTGRKYGWYKCRFNCQWIPQFDVKPQKFKEKLNGSPWVEVIYNNKRKIYPVGNRTQWITAAEYWWMKKHHYFCEAIHPFLIEWVQDNNKYPSPFEWIPKIYNERREIVKTDKTGMLQYALKILLNGLYGKTAQAKRGKGKLTNFFYASYITAETRLKVAEVALKHLKNVIEIATDSVTLNKPIDDIPISKKLGEWGLDKYVKGLFIGSGMRQEWYAEDTDSREYVTYARGLTDKRDFDMKAEMELNRDSAELIFCKRRPIHMGEMLMHKYKLKFEQLGVFTPVRKTLNANTDTKSQWERSYDNFGDFLESSPMSGKPLEVLQC